MKIQTRKTIGKNRIDARKTKPKASHSVEYIGPPADPNFTAKSGPLASRIKRY
jgi:hypothetical protein